jgi:putative molybdopterin biosynthesis protein
VSETRLSNSLRRHRARLGLSQQALGELTGVTRQAIIAIESGRQVPSTILALRLAHATGATVEDLFEVTPAPGLSARLAPANADAASATDRVAVGDVDGVWVAHRLPAGSTDGADGIVGGSASEGITVVSPLTTLDRLERNVLVAGCAPLLATLADRVAMRFADARVTWLPATSGNALDLLAEGLVHVAGVHLPGARSGETNVTAVRRRFSDRRMLIVNLTRWRQGFVVAPGNPLRIRSAADLLRPEVHFARRDRGAGAYDLLCALLAAEGVEDGRLPGPLARGHVDVARLVQCGAADAGVAIESVALAAGLTFVPLTEERFDLVVPSDASGAPPVSRLLEALDDAAFRTEMAHLPGYDGDICGHVTTLEAA